MNQLIYSVFYLISAFISAGLALYGWQYRRTSGVPAFVAANILMTIWPVCQALSVMITDVDSKIVLLKLQSDAPVFAAVAFLILVAQLTGQGSLFTKNRLILLLILPFLGVFLNWTSPTPLFRYNFRVEIWQNIPTLHWDNGYLFWIWLIYTYGLILFAVFLVGKSLRLKSDLSVRQTMALLLYGMVLLALSLVFQISVKAVSGLNLLPIIQSFLALLITSFLFRFYKTQIAPMARGLLFDQMNDAVIILDGRDRIVDMNKAARMTFAPQVQTLNELSDATTIEGWGSLLEFIQNGIGSQAVLKLLGNSVRHFEIRISPVFNTKNVLIGRMLFFHEITDRKLVEQQLRETESFFQQMAENTRDVFWITDPFTKKEIYISPAVERVWGRNKQEFFDSPDLYFESIFEEDRVWVSKVLERQENGETTNTEYRIKRPDGTIRWVWDRGFPILDETGKVKVIAGIVTDITERRQTVEALRFSEERNRLLNELMSDYIYESVRYHDGTEKILWASGAVEKITGYTVEDLNSLPGGFAHVFFEDEQQDLNLVPTFLKGDPISVEYRIRRKDGKVRWLLDYIKPVAHDSPAQDFRILGAVQDITLRKQAQIALEESEQRYRMLIESTPDSIIMFDNSGEVRMANIHANEMFGFNSGEVLTGRQIFDHILPEEIPLAYDNYQNAAQTGKPSTVNLYLLKKGETGFHAEATVGVVKNSSGDISHSIAVIKDVSEQKEAEARLLESEARYRGLFEDSPVSLWEEDFSEVKKYINSLHRQGVTDIRAYLDEHPEVVRDCLNLVKIIDVNKVTLQLFKAVSKNELLGNMSSIFSTDDLADFKGELINIAEGKTHFEWVGYNRTMNGGTVIINMQWSVVPGYEESLSRVIIAVTDITAIKNTEKELDRQNRQLRALHLISLELQNKLKVDDLLQLLVEEASNLLEAPYGELMLEEEGELVVRAYTANQPYLKGDRIDRSRGKLSWQAFDSGQPVIMDDYMKWPDHRQIYDEVSIHAVADFPIIVANRCLGVLAMGRGQADYVFDEQQIQTGKQFAELAALALSNVQLLENTSLQAAALNAAANAIVITDQKGTIQWVNSAFTKLTGYSANEAIGQNPRILKSGRTSQAIHQQLWETIMSGHVWHGELYNRRKSGKDYIEEMTVTPLKDDNNKIYRFIAVKQDITERKKAEDALRTSEEKYRSIFENVEDVFYTTDYRGHIVTISPSILKWSGFRPDEVIGRHVGNFFLNEEDYDQLDQEVSTRGALNDYEMKMKRKDGSLIYVSATARVVFDQEGQPCGTEGVMRDISERKESELRELRRGALLEKVVELGKLVSQPLSFEECLRAIHSAVQVGLGFDRVGIFMYNETNREVQGMVGTSRSGEIESNSWYNQSIDNPADTSWITALENPKGYFILDNYEEHNVVPDGNEMKGVKENLIVSAWAGDKPIAFITIDNLITQRPFSREQLEALQLFAGYAGLAIENSRWNSQLEERVKERTAQLQEANSNLSILVESSMVLNKNLNLDDVLDHMLAQAQKTVPCRALSIMFREEKDIRVVRHLGYPIGDEADLEFSDDKALASWPNYQTMINQKESILVSNTQTDPNWRQEPFSNWVQSYIGIPIVVDGETIGFLNANHNEADFFDETDVLMLEALTNNASIAIQNARLLGDLIQSLEKEQTMRAQLVHADKLAALGKMVAVIAHEINNPIQTVKNAFFLIEDEIKPDSPAQEYLRIAKSEASRISDLVSQLRETYRTRSKTFTRVNVSDLLTEVHNILSPQLRKSQVVWEQPEGRASYIVFAVRNNLKQVFINLAINAIEAMEKDHGGILSVQVKLSPDGKQVGVRIHDTGPLISEDDLAHIFEPFFTTKGSGSGLGLSISYDIIQHHMGRIEVENEDQQGVSFTVWLPLASQEEEA